MRVIKVLLVTTASLALMPALAHAEEGRADGDGASVATKPVAETQAKPEATAETKPAKPAAKSFSTGVARGRDLLDSAISTSGLSGDDLHSLSSRSLGELLRNIPGLRVEYHGDESQTNITVRGLPMAGTGNKYIQIQEDGLPILEFGDVQPYSSSMFLRADTNLASVETIRGGSASTFASNSPGGVINLISKTGDEAGGQVRLTKGIDFGENRIEMDYGRPLGNGWRFHIGGFYRKGDGPRNTGFSDMFRGGQVKFNVTKEFTGGFVRVYGKWLDDYGNNFNGIPITVSGTDDNPVYRSISNFSARDDAISSRYFPTMQLMDQNNRPQTLQLRDAVHARSRTLGFEAQYNFSGWNLTNKFRYADNDGGSNDLITLTTLPAGMLSAMFGGPGAVVSLATGPQAGQVVTNLSTLGGNGLMAMGTGLSSVNNSLGNVINDARISKVWKVAGGDLTFTSGLYYSRQDVDFVFNASSYFQTITGNGNSNLVDITTAGGMRLTQGGIFSFGTGLFGGPISQWTKIKYNILAPYGSLNFRIGKIAVGASVRRDSGRARGQLFGAPLGGGRVGFAPYDWNGDNVISNPEMMTSVLPLDRPAPVRYNYGYTSYSTGVNYRMAQDMSLFARYSHGARASADRIAFTPAIAADGSLAIPSMATSPVDQAEVGVKFRRDGIMLNLTGFWAQARETDVQYVLSTSGVQIVNFSRVYRTHGAEFEGAVQSGIFSISAGATYTHARIASDSANASVVGNKPRRQPDFLFQLTPQIKTAQFALGANIIGTTSSYSNDSNQLKLPGYTIVSTFLAWKPTEKVTVSLNANNLFDKLAITEINEATIPGTGVVAGRFLNGRTVSTSLSYSF